MQTERGPGNLRGDKNKLRKTRNTSDVQEYGFPYRNIEIRNGLKN